MEIKVPNKIKLKDIFVDIHCIGKNPEGEGIIIIVRKNDYILYSALIDEYISEKNIENEQIKFFDLICWSHPHDDHSEGIDKVIKKYTSKQTKIIVPTGISDVKKNMTPKCKSIYKPIMMLNKHNKKINGEYVEVNQYCEIINNTYIDNNGKKIELKIKALSPISKRINNLRLNKIVNMNDLSVCLILCINNVNFLFSSDIYDDVIKDMNFDSETFNNIIYYKIPHHGSCRSDNLLLKIPESANNRIAVTTIYKKNGQDVTPNIETLNKYIDKGLKVYCTSESYINNSEIKYDYGVISTRIKISNIEQDDEIYWDIKCEGEALEVDRKREENLFVDN